MPNLKREISPATNATADEYLKVLPAGSQALIAEIRRQKAADSRPRPSGSLVGFSVVLTEPRRRALLDAVAALVDENLSGRSDMCQQFADLLHRALTHLSLTSRPVVGVAMYFSPDGKELFRWKHAWVRLGDEVIDGNTDCLFENPRFPKTISAAPYWGPFKEPPGRRLREEYGASLPVDTDVSEIWWPDLKDWLDTDFLKL
jgi:hypothetical protein